MPYPSTVDSGISPPWALYDGDLGSNFTSGALVTNTAYLVGVYLPSPATLTGIRVRFASGGAGNFDVGIYDVNGNLIWNNGAAATSSALVTKSAATPVPLAQGAYWLALWMSNNTDTVYKLTSIVAGASITQSGTASSHLPSSTAGLSSLANSTVKPFIVGLLQGMWS